MLSTSRELPLRRRDATASSCRHRAVWTGNDRRRRQTEPGVRHPTPARRRRCDLHVRRLNCSIFIFSCEKSRKNRLFLHEILKEHCVPDTQTHRQTHDDGI